MMTGLAATGAWLIPSAAPAAWSTSGSGDAAAAATSMPTGLAPAAAVTGATATVSWTQADMADGNPVAGYLVHRYNETTGAQATVGGTCAGVVVSTSCSETLPPGSWTYTDTPVQLSWTGQESPAGNSVTVRLT